MIDPSQWWRAHLEDTELHVSEEQVRAQIDGVDRFLSLEVRSRVLELACGSGWRTLELARRGHRVLGLHPSEKPLIQARHSARVDRLNAHFLKNDSVQTSYRAEFDAVVALSSALGRFPGDNDDERLMASVERALKPGGKFLIDLLNKEWLMRHFEPNSWEQPRGRQGEVLLEQVSFNFEMGRLDSHRTIVGKDGARTPAHVSLRVYTLTEVKALIEKAGLIYDRSWGAFDGSAYGMDSPRLIVLARRSSDAERRKKPRPDDHLLAIKIKGRRRR